MRLRLRVCRSSGALSLSLGPLAALRLGTRTLPAQHLADRPICVYATGCNGLGVWTSGVSVCVYCVCGFQILFCPCESLRVWVFACACSCACAVSSCEAVSGLAREVRVFPGARAPMRVCVSVALGALVLSAVCLA